jgi:hypothetical protein
LEILKELHGRLVALEGPQPYDPPIPGEDGKDGNDANCDDVTVRLDALIGRVEVLETMLRPDASGRLTGLPPMWVTYHNDVTGEELTVKVYLGDGFLAAPPQKITPSLSGGGR